MATTTDQRSHDLIELMENFNTGMLVTKSKDGGLRSRPMAIAEVDEDSGDIIFATSLETEKVDELLRHPNVNVSLQSKTTYLSLTGQATIEQDEDRIEELWDETWKLWFPEGKEQDDLALIRVKTETGEYWDLSGTEVLSFLYEAGKAFIKDDEIDYDQEGTNATVSLD